MNARQQLAAELDDATSDRVMVVANPRQVDTLGAGRVLLQVVRTQLLPAEQNPLGGFKQDFDIWVVVPHRESEAGEDSLDDALDEVIEVLDAFDWMLWEKAERGTYLDTFIGYKITATLNAKKE